MFIPLRTDSPLRTTPYMNWALIAGNTVAFIIQLHFQRDGRDEAWMLDPRDPHLWQYFTYMFMHASWLHLISNMLFLYIFGNNVNDRMGQIGYLGFYLAGGVAAGTAHVLNSEVPVLGASGAVFAVTGAYLALLPRSHVTILYLLFLIGLIEIPSIWFIGLRFSMELIDTVAPGLLGGADAVAHIAHVAGAGFGFMVCLVLLSVGLLPRDQFDVLALLARWNKRRQYRDLVASGYDPFGYLPTTNRKGPDPRLDRIQDLRAQISEAIAHQAIDDAMKLYLELRAIDPQQVLARQSQLDVANQLYHTRQYPAAADTYELFLQHYPKAEQFEQVQLMLGILYSRYLQRYDRAQQHLRAVLDRVHGTPKYELAQEELAKVEAALAQTKAT
jgi:membrane associated rhomboid family serine protease